jgi:uncharacterized delta-60 repeat protein
MWSLFRRNLRPARSARRTPPTVRPRLEALEDRFLLSAGALDPTFGNGGVTTTSLSSGDDVADNVLIQPNGKIVVAGSTAIHSGTFMSLTRYNANGTLDSTFGSGGEEISKVRGGGPAVLDPGITDSSGNEAIVEASGSNVALFNPNGSLNTAFGNKGTVTVPYTIAGVVVQQVGSSYDIVVAGDNGTDFELTRFTSSGKVDTSFGTNGTATLAPPPGVAGLSAEVLQIQPNGDLVVGGEGIWPSPVFDVARFTRTASGTRASAAATAISPAPSGPIISATCALPSTPAQARTRQITARSWW